MPAVTPAQSLDQLCINTIRFLSIDAVENAKSGHPGTPMGAAALAYTLWDRFLKHNPRDPKWPDRDRFVLSCGHACMLLYAILHLTGYDLSLEDIRNFRQWGSKTPGHLEYGVTPGVEATTGPLGQGMGNATGMAMAEKWLAQKYNRPGYDLINHRTFVLLSDGDLEEGATSEAASLAGAMRLGKLVAIYDDNGITIEGPAAMTFRENVAQRFTAYGWRVIGPIDGMSVEIVDAALKEALSESEQPTLIICRTVIGYGSPNKQGKASAHGEPLGQEEVRLTRQNLGWMYSEPFTVPLEALGHTRQAVDRGVERERGWNAMREAYSTAFTGLSRQFEADLGGELPDGWDEGVSQLFKARPKPLSTREASGLVMNSIAGKVAALAGGSADLAPSTKTYLDGFADFDSAGPGRNLHFGLREHAMGAVANGMALHGGVIPYTGTFLVFCDYMRPPVRLAAMMGIRVIYVFTHDSIGLGQDGPTHQPIEHLAGMRAVPNLTVIRPADATETAEAWKIALERHSGPTALILTRQGLPVLDRSGLAPAGGVRSGGYTLWQASDSPEMIIIGSGSEVHQALDAGRKLAHEGVAARVVSFPSWQLFDAQSQEYRDSVLPPAVRKRITIEAASPLGWERYAGSEGCILGLSRFGASAPGDVVYQKLGLTGERIVKEARRMLAGGRT